MAQEFHDLFFIGQDDIRHGCIAMGHVRDRPLYYHFHTETVAPGHTRTTVNI